MFTGIVQSKARLAWHETRPQLKTLSVELTPEQRDGLTLGASIALNGVCLTVTRLEGERAVFDVMMETLRVTNLAKVQEGDWVNVERAAKFGDDVGGHVMSGHIHTTAPVLAIERPDNNCVLWFGLNDASRPYLFNKGYVGLNGCSLTIGEVQADRFNVFLIPETLKVTNLGQLQVGDDINVEVDAHTQSIVDTLHRMREAGQLGTSKNYLRR